MRTSIQAIIALVIVLMVVVGIYAAASNTFNSAGDNVKQGGSDSSDRLECIFGNPATSDAACDRESNLEKSNTFDNYVKKI